MTVDAPPIPLLYFLKLGGSLITDKNRPHTARPEILARLAAEIAAGLRANPALRLLVGHGSGSFGHVAGGRYGTRQGVSSPEQWLGFLEVWREAAALDRLVVDALHAAGLPAIVFPPSSGAISRNGIIQSWDVTPLQAALQAGLLPLVYGDVAFDAVRGGTILSTEDVFDYLEVKLRPQRLLLTGLEPGVWEDYPACTRLVDQITPVSLEKVSTALGGSSGMDVTGGMASKVQQSLRLVQRSPGLEVLIFSSEEAGAVEAVLAGDRRGTIVRAD